MNRIEEDYEELLELAPEYDSCFVRKTWGATLIEEKKDTYWKIRQELEMKIAAWMANVRKMMNTIPPSAKKFVTETHLDPSTGEEYSTKVYDDLNFEAILHFHRHIQDAIEAYDGVLEGIKKEKLIFGKLRSVRGDVLSFVKTLTLFAPEILMTVEQQVDLVFKLRDLGMLEVAELIEDIDQIEANIEKCAKVRSALEKTIQYYCDQHGITTRKRFFSDLDEAIKSGMTTKEKRKKIAEHYSFISKIIHKEIESNTRNTQYAVYGTLEILQELLSQAEKKAQN